MDKKLDISRQVYKQDQFDAQFAIKTKPNEKTSIGIKLLKSIDPRNILNLFTIFNLITEYNFKNDFVADIFAGLTVGIMHIPVSLAYGALTSLNPVNGLYTSFYTGLTYVIFGTSKHLSVGTYAVVSLMVYSTISRLESEYIESDAYLKYKESLSINQNNLTFVLNNATTNSVYEIDNHIMEFRVRVSTSLAFWCGIVQIILAICRFGIIYKYLSKAMLRGFTTAAACYVFTTQLQHVLGIYVKPKTNRTYLKLFFTYVRLFKNIHLINWTAVIISVISITFLIVMRIQVNERFKKQLRNIPLPIELVVIIAGTSSTYFLKMNQKYNLVIVGKIPSGLVKPSLPEIDLFTDVIKDAIIIAIVAFASSISVSDLYARKHKYKINSNKEIFALGMSNVVGSFFKSFVSCGALARTVVFESSGGRSQLVTVIASGIILAVLLWISPLLEMLPKSCLGSIIIAALVSLFKQFQDIKYYWNLDKRDFTLWMVTFGSAILLDIDYGLLIGILAILISNTFRLQKIQINELGRINNTEIHRNISKYNANEFPDIKLIQPTQSIHYANCDQFQTKLNELCPLKDAKEPKTICDNCSNNYGCTACRNKKETNLKNKSKNEYSENDDENLNKTEFIPKQYFKIIIIDFTLVHFIDEFGVKCLQKIKTEYNNDGVEIALTNCNDSVRTFLKKLKCEWDDIIYLTINDALTFKSI